MTMADTQPPVSLTEFAATTPDNRPRCLLCSVEAEVERQARAGKDAGITYRVIGQWLETIIDPALTNDRPITKGRLERHFQDGHPAR